jgi:two-component system, OmpR family, phosphate regulon sensor histidine kinase PhoR
MSGSSRMTPVRLRWILGLLFVALAVPSVVLVAQALRQLEWETFHQHRQLAVELADRIDSNLQRMIAVEEARGIADYGYFIVSGAPGQPALLQRSPLAGFPVDAALPGALGWFQVDATGRFSTPLLPSADALARIGIGAEELAARRAREEQLLDVLGNNRLVQRRREPPVIVTPPVRSEEPGSAGEMSTASPRPPAPATAPALASDGAERTALPPPQLAFDQLNLQRDAPVAALAEKGHAEKQDARRRFSEFSAEPAEDAGLGPARAQAPPAARSRRAEQSMVPDVAPLDAADAPAAASLRIFDSELDPFEFARLDSGHFVLFRRVWRNGDRLIQGVLIEQAPFVRGLAEPFGASLLSRVSEMRMTWRGEPLQQVSARPVSTDVDGDAGLGGTLLHQARLSAPLADMEVAWAVVSLPRSPGASLVTWAGMLLLAVLVAGFVALYRLGCRQVQLARQQQDFIAAVSHELKTPLTSIRMYGELLRAGWVAEDRRREYYDYIHDESERLSRLIANVLQLARLERDTLQLDRKPVTVGVLCDVVRSRIRSQVERAGFELAFEVVADVEALELEVDADAVVQVMINLVDNALKFSAQAAARRVEVTVAGVDRGQVAFDVRDFGPGVPPALRRRVFELFVRGGNELTREAQGTGIGLALVRQLARAMGGEVELLPVSPGAMFRLRLPLSG